MDRHYLEPYAGHQSFRRNGRKTDDFFGGAYGTFGYEISENASFEMNAEGGNYALATAAGWRYYLIGLRLVINQHSCIYQIKSSA
jgi:hypothetical protein